MEEQGYIALYRKMMNWDWYQDSNTKSLFIHLLLKANHKDAKYQGELIKRGQHKTGLFKLSAETGLSIQQLRTSIKKLEKTNDITSKSTNKYRIITVIKYDTYQSTNKHNNKQVTIKQQSSNNQVTTNNNDYNENTVKNDNKKDIATPTSKTFIIPTIKEIEEYCKERKNNVNSNKFYHFYESKGWLVGKTKMKSWKSSVITWESNDKDSKKDSGLFTADDL